MRGTFVATAFVITAIGCTGSIGEGGGGGDPSTSGEPGQGSPGSSSGKPGATPGAPNAPGGGASPAATAVSCPATAVPALAATPMHRLTEAEYDNTIKDLFGADALAAVSGSVSLTDARAAHEFSVLAQGITSQHVLGYYQAADLLAGFLTATPAKLAALSPCLGQAQVAVDTCVRPFVDKIGRRILRRPLAPDELTGLVDTYNQGLALGVADGVRLVLFSLLQSPYFIYRPETQGAPVAGASDRLKLTAFELAARLSYLAWGSTPDDKLLDAAASGQLDADAGLASEVDRLLADGRARAWVQRFFGEWLEVDSLPPPAQSDAFLAGISKNGLLGDMQKEVVQYTLFHALDGGGKGTFKDLMTSTVSFVPSANLGKLYGVTAPAGGGQMALAADQRGGLLTRAAMLVESDESTSPIQRGARVRRKLLCAPIPPPDPSAFPPNTIVPPPFSPNKTARQRWTEQTSQGVCNACHSQFNSLGYALENYDTLGRFRQMEPIIDPKTNKVVNNLPIDATVDVLLIDRTASVTGAVGLGAALAEDSTARQCFAQEWMKFGYGRMDAPEDACLQAQLADTGGVRGIREMFRQSVLAPTFRLRKVVP